MLPSTIDCLSCITEAWTAAQEVLRKAQDWLTPEMTHYKTFEVGSLIWLEGTNLKRTEGTPKLSPRRYRPFKVAAQISHVAYQLDLPETWKIHNVFHASLLTPYHEMAKHGPNYLQPPPDIINDAPEWEIEKIIKACTFGCWKKKQYLAHWKGYSPAHDSWVNSKDMHAEDLISDFKKDASIVIKAAVACQEVTMPFVPYFPPFLSTYAAEPHLPGSLDMEADNESNQGYSDEDQPMSPEAYDPDEPPTPTTANPPSRLIAYDTDPHGGWGPPSDWLTEPPTPLLEIMLNTEPWPYPPE